MLNVEQIEEWLGQEVMDADGERVGKLDEVFYSVGSGEATFAAIKSGMLGRHSDLVPLAGASVGRDYLRLAVTVNQIEQAGSEVSVQENLDPTAARRLGELYGVDVAEDEEFEGASTVNARRQAAAEASLQANELEEQARQRAAEAERAQGIAQGAQQDAEQKTEQSQHAREDAERARAEAERINQP